MKHSPTCDLQILLSPSTEIDQTGIQTLHFRLCAIPILVRASGNCPFMLPHQKARRVTKCSRTSVYQARIAWCDHLLVGFVSEALHCFQVAIPQSHARYMIALHQSPHHIHSHSLFLPSPPKSLTRSSMALSQICTPHSPIVRGKSLRVFFFVINPCPIGNFGIRQGACMKKRVPKGGAIKCEPPTPPLSM